MSFSATGNMLPGYAPAPHYGYPAAMYQPLPQQFQYQHYYYAPVRYHQPSLPFPQEAPAAPVQKAPETINHKTTSTVAVISRPQPEIKPAVTDIAEPSKPQPKKVLPDSKMVFLNKIAPIVHEVNARVLSERGQLLSTIDAMEQGNKLNADQISWLETLMSKYRVKDKSVKALHLRTELLPRVDIIPVELALAQAANESAWGKSRFAREAQNLFGVWTYDESKGIVPKKRAKGATHLVRKYESTHESIEHYITLLNSHPAYRSLRDIRLEFRNKGEQPDGFVMAAGLVKYSAKGEQYVAIIRSMIDTNDLTDFRSA